MFSAKVSFIYMEHKSLKEVRKLGDHRYTFLLSIDSTIMYILER